MSQSITVRSATFAMQIEGHPDCAGHPACQSEGLKLFESLIDWIQSTSQRDHRWEAGISGIFSLLETLHSKHALSNEQFYELSKRAKVVVENFGEGSISPELAVFLQNFKIYQMPK